MMAANQIFLQNVLTSFTAVYFHSVLKCFQCSIPFMGMEWHLLPCTLSMQTLSPCVPPELLTPKLDSALLKGRQKIRSQISKHIWHPSPEVLITAPIRLVLSAHRDILWLLLDSQREMYPAIGVEESATWIFKDWAVYLNVHTGDNFIYILYSSICPRFLVAEQPNTAFWTEVSNCCV